MADEDIAKDRKNCATFRVVSGCGVTVECAVFDLQKTKVKSSHKYVSGDPGTTWDLAAGDDVPGREGGGAAG